MNYRYYICNGGTWIECGYRTYSTWLGKKYRSVRNVHGDLSSVKIKVEEKKYIVGTTVELEVRANSLSEAKNILYKKLKDMGLDVGDLNGFEVPKEDEEAED